MAVVQPRVLVVSLRRVRIVFVVVCSLVASVLSGFPQTPVVGAQEVDAPVVAVDDVVWTEVDSSIDVAVTDNDSDDSDDAVVGLSVESPSAGLAEVVVIDDEPSVLFTPEAGFDGVATFGYEACVDGGCSSAVVTVYVGTSACTIVGTDSADTLVGTAGDDVICALRGADVVNAGAGDDLVFGGRGHDTLDGGDGADVLRGSHGDDTITGGRGADRLHGGPGSDDLSGNRGADTLFGGKGSDLLKGGRGNDVLIGKAGNDTLNGGNGQDILHGWRGDDVLNGDANDDELYGGRDADVLNGGDGNDLLKGKRGQDTLNGDAGDDDLRGNRGNDVLDGGEGIDTLDGGNGTDTCQGETIANCEDGPVDPPTEPVYCGDEIATIVGTDGADNLVGTEDDDVIAGLGGDDIIDGLGGDDLICAGLGNDTVQGGSGLDWISGDEGNDDLDGGAGDDRISGGTGEDTLAGGLGTNYLNGDDGNDIITGGDEQDEIDGGLGDDEVRGGAGDDAVDGGPGDDLVDGGPDTDYCGGGETTLNCETQVPAVTEYDLFDEFEPVESVAPAGEIEVIAPPGMDPLRLVIDSPGGIVADDVSITGNQIASASVGDFAVSPTYELSLPEGAPTFNSATLTIPYREELLGDTPVADLRIATFDVSRGRWIVVPGSQVVDPVAGTVTADIDHFSSYVVIRYKTIADLIANEAAQGRLDRIVEAQSVGCTALNSSYRDAVLADNPVSYWRLGGSDPLADEQGLSPISGAPTSVNPMVPSTVDGASHFLYSDNATSPIASVPASLFQSDFTFEFWFNEQDGVPAQFVLGGAVSLGTFNDASGLRVDVQLSGSTIRTGLFGGDHVVFQKKGDVLSIMLNGQIQFSQPLNGQTIAFDAAAGLTFPRGNLAKLHTPLTGAIDEVAIYDHAIGELAAARHFGAGLGDQDVEDGDGDLLPDCEEREGLLSLSWLAPSSLDGVDRTILSVRTDPRDIDTDDDLLADGQELQAEEISTTDLLTTDERDALLAVGLTKIYRAISYPWTSDSDLDGTSDFVELQNANGDPFLHPQWEPLRARDVDQLLEYPQSTLFQPEVLGTAPFLGGLNGLVPIRNIEQRGELIASTSRYYEHTVLFDSDFLCTANCGPLRDYVQKIVFPRADYICLATSGRNCVTFDDAEASVVLQMIQDQQVFVANASSPSGVDIDGSVVGGQVFATCILYDIPCSEPTPETYLDLASFSPVAVGVSAAATATAYAERVGSESEVKLEDPGADQRSQRSKLRRARIGIFFAISLPAATLAQTPNAFELDYVRRVDECESVLELPNQQGWMSALPDFIRVNVPGYGVAMLDPCRGGIPVYFPGNDVLVATIHRADAISRQGQPALLSHARRLDAVARMSVSVANFPERWFNIVEFGPCQQDGSDCDEYPNFASGESGPYQRLGIQILGNQRTASLCLMDPIANRKEGRQYRSFKLKNGMKDRSIVPATEAGIRRYFLVVPDLNAPTSSISVPDFGDNYSTQPRREGAGSYPPPPNFAPQDYAGQCAP